MFSCKSFVAYFASGNESSGKFEVEDSFLHLGVVQANVANCFSRVVGVLACEKGSHIDDGNPCWVLAGLPDLMWPTSAEEFFELLSQIRAIHHIKGVWAEKALQLKAVLAALLQKNFFATLRVFPLTDDLGKRRE